MLQNTNALLTGKISRCRIVCTCLYSGRIAARPVAFCVERRDVHTIRNARPSASPGSEKGARALKALWKRFLWPKLVDDHISHVVSGVWSSLLSTVGWPCSTFGTSIHTASGKLFCNKTKQVRPRNKTPSSQIAALTLFSLCRVRYQNHDYPKPTRASSGSSPITQFRSFCYITDTFIKAGSPEEVNIR